MLIPSTNCSQSKGVVDLPATYSWIYNSGGDLRTVPRVVSK